jgi:2-polyprenyl-3-methyl-5-hydroxy-6-metoxy-1,4-benzoquinol methylase
MMEGSVLDVGAGTCKGIELLESKGLDITGIECDARLEGKHPKLKIGDLSMFEDKSFDYVTCVDVIEHIVEDLVAFNHMKRIARKGIFITTPNYTRSGCGNIAHCREYTIAQFANIFQPDEIWSASPDGSLHKTLVLEKVGKYYIDHSPEGADNTLDMILLAYKKVPLDARFNYTVDGEEWGHICGIWRF